MCQTLQYDHMKISQVPRGHEHITKHYRTRRRTHLVRFLLLWSASRSHQPAVPLLHLTEAIWLLSHHSSQRRMCDSESDNDSDCPRAPPAGELFRGRKRKKNPAGAGFRAEARGRCFSMPALQRRRQRGGLVFNVYLRCLRL